MDPEEHFRPSTSWLDELPDCLSHLRPDHGSSRKPELRPVEEIPHPYQQVFAEYSCFNYIQSKVLDDVFYTDKSLVIAAPTGSGKTAIFELAIVHLLNSFFNGRDISDTIFKIIYICPMKALCEERLVDWNKKFSTFGISCISVTGDSEHTDFKDLIHHNLIITTPEKWDCLTRKWRDNENLVNVIKLFMIDEVHLLNEDQRGSCLETIVCRMKTIEQNLSGQNNSKMRVLAASATISNIEDVAEWIGRPPNTTYYKFSDEYRPVKLNTIVIGYPCNPKLTPFRFDMSLNYKLQHLMMTYSNGKPILIFCSTRKIVEMTAKYLVQNLSINLNPEQKACLQSIANRISDIKLKETVVHGIGYHHAGMLPETRRTIENAFRNNEMPILITTSTLAMGVNLPAHLVIVKSTKVYQSGGYTDYTETALLQMTGRAGRPQFDTSATALILTTMKDKEKFEKMVGGLEPIESNLHKHLVEHLNAEICLRTITDLEMAVCWLNSTFLYIRARKNPRHYGLPFEPQSGQIDARLLEMCKIALNKLVKGGMIQMDDDTVMKATETGMLMARYYLDYETMELFTQMTGHEILQQILNLISRCHEFSELYLRVNDKKYLNILNNSKNAQTIRFPLNGKIKTVDMKINCLIQAVLGCLDICDHSLLTETIRIMRNAERIVKCLIEYLRTRDKCFNALLSTITLAKCFNVNLWENSPYVSKQLQGIGNVMSSQLANAGKTTFEAILETDARDIEMIINKHPPAGNRLLDQVRHLPKYGLKLEHFANKKLKLIITLQNRSDLEQSWSVPSNSLMYLLVGDSSNNVLLHEKYLHSYMFENIEVIKYINVKEGGLEEIQAHFISEDWVGFDCSVHYGQAGLKKKSVSNEPLNLYMKTFLEKCAEHTKGLVLNKSVLANESANSVEKISETANNRDPLEESDDEQFFDYSFWFGEERNSNFDAEKINLPANPSKETHPDADTDHISSAEKLHSPIAEITNFTDISDSENAVNNVQRKSTESSLSDELLEEQNFDNLLNQLKYEELEREESRCQEVIESPLKPRAETSLKTKDLPYNRSNQLHPVPLQNIETDKRRPQGNFKFRKSNAVNIEDNEALGASENYKLDKNSPNPEDLLVKNQKETKKSEHVMENSPFGSRSIPSASSLGQIKEEKFEPRKIQQKFKNLEDNWLLVDKEKSASRSSVSSANLMNGHSSTPRYGKEKSVSSGTVFHQFHEDKREPKTKLQIPKKLEDYSSKEERQVAPQKTYSYKQQQRSTAEIISPELEDKRVLLQKSHPSTPRYVKEKSVSSGTLFHQFHEDKGEPKTKVQIFKKLEDYPSKEERQVAIQKAETYNYKQQRPTTERFSPKLEDKWVLNTSLNRQSNVSSSNRQEFKFKIPQQSYEIQSDLPKECKQKINSFSLDKSKKKLRTEELQSAYLSEDKKKGAKITWRSPLEYSPPIKFAPRINYSCLSQGEMDSQRSNKRLFLPLSDEQCQGDGEQWEEDTLPIIEPEAPHDSFVKKRKVDLSQSSRSRTSSDYYSELMMKKTGKRKCEIPEIAKKSDSFKSRGGSSDTFYTAETGTSKGENRIPRSEIQESSADRRIFLPLRNYSDSGVGSGLGNYSNSIQTKGSDNKENEMPDSFADRRTYCYDDYPRSSLTLRKDLDNVDSGLLGNYSNSFADQTFNSYRLPTEPQDNLNLSFQAYNDYHKNKVLNSSGGRNLDFNCSTDDFVHSIKLSPQLSIEDRETIASSSEAKYMRHLSNSFHERPRPVYVEPTELNSRFQDFEPSPRAEYSFKEDFRDIHPHEYIYTQPVVHFSEPCANDYEFENSPYQASFHNKPPSTVTHNAMPRQYSYNRNLDYSFQQHPYDYRPDMRVQYAEPRFSPYFDDTRPHFLSQTHYPRHIPRVENRIVESQPEVPSYVREQQFCPTRTPEAKSYIMEKFLNCFGSPRR